MPADKLELLCYKIRPRFLESALDSGVRKGGYANVIELPTMSAVLHCRGYYDGIHKLVFRNVAHLGYTYCENVAAEVFGDLSRVRITRVDWCVDILGVSLLELTRHLRIGHVQNCRLDHSRSGDTFYPRLSKARTILVYDKLREREWRHDPVLEKYVLKGPLTRVEVQFRSNLPYRCFDELGRYADLDLLPNLSFWQVRRQRSGLKARDTLAAEGLVKRIKENGFQLTAKMYSAQEWAYLKKSLLEPVPISKFHDLNKLLQKSARDWLEDRIRFPRYPPKRAA